MILKAKNSFMLLLSVLLISLQFYSCSSENDFYDAIFEEEEIVEESDDNDSESSDEDSEENDNGEESNDEDEQSGEETDESSDTPDNPPTPEGEFTITSIGDLSASSNANKIGVLNSNLSLGGQNITLAPGLVLKAGGGLFQDGTISGNNSSVSSEVIEPLFAPSIEISGSWYGDVHLAWFTPQLDGSSATNYAFDNAFKMLSSDTTFYVDQEADYRINGFISTFRSPAIYNVTYNFKGRLMPANGTPAEYGTLRIQQKNATYNNLHVDGNRNNISNPGVGIGKTSNVDLATSENITFNDLNLSNSITTACTANTVKNIRVNGFYGENIGEHVFYFAFGAKGFYLHDFTIDRFGASAVNVNHETNILKTVGYYGEESQAEFVNGYINMPPGTGTESPKTFFSNTVPNTLIENVNMSSDSHNFYVMYASDDSSIVRIKNCDFNDDNLFYNITNQVPAGSGTYSSNGANANNTFYIENSKFGGWYLNLINEAINCTITVRWSLQKDFQVSTTVPNTKQTFKDCNFIFTNEIDYRSVNGDIIFDNCSFTSSNGTYAALSFNDSQTGKAKVLFDNIDVNMPDTYFVNASSPTDISLEFKDSDLTAYKSSSPVLNPSYFEDVRYTNTTGKGGSTIN